MIKNRYIQFSANTKFTPEKYPVYLKLPWTGNVSIKLTEQIKRPVSRCFNAINQQFVFKSNSLFTPNIKDCVSFIIKDSIG